MAMHTRVGYCNEWCLIIHGTTFNERWVFRFTISLMHFTPSRHGHHNLSFSRDRPLCIIQSMHFCWELRDTSCASSSSDFECGWANASEQRVNGANSMLQQVGGPQDWHVIIHIIEKFNFRGIKEAAICTNCTSRYVSELGSTEQLSLPLYVSK